MKKSEEIYKKLRESLSDEEIVESYVFNDDSVDEEELAAAEKEFRELRLKQIQSMTEAEVLFGKLMKLKYGMIDYFEANKFNQQYSFSNQLKAYSKIINRSNKTFAQDLGLHHTKLSRILNGRESPNVELMYRLEEHSKSELPAHFWWRLHSMELEYKISTDLEKRIEESKKVSNTINIRA